MVAASALFLYAAKTVHPLGASRLSKLVSRSPAVASALLYVVGITGVNILVEAVGLRALFTIQVMASLLAMAFALDFLMRLGFRGVYAWLPASLAAAAAYSLTLGYSLGDSLVALALVPAGAAAGVAAGMLLTRSTRRVDVVTAATLAFVVFLAPLLLGSLDSFLRYERLFFPPRP